MPEISVPALVPAAPADNLSDLVITNAREAPDAVAFARPVDGRWQDVTCAQFLEEVTAVARGLVAAGVGPGDRVAGYLPDVGEAVVAFLGTAAVGAVWSCTGQDYAAQVGS